MQSLIFFGSDQYSAVVLSALILSGDSRKITVVTDPREGGTSVDKLAKEHNLLVSYYPDFDRSLITENTLGLCASFDHLIPAEIIKLFDGNLYNLHPSLLPQYRNVSPVQYAIALGDTETGITLFRISTGIDNGEIISQAAEPILPDDTTPTLTARLFKLGAQLFQEHLNTPGVKGASHSRSVIPLGVPLVFTRRLTRDSGFVEWPVLQKLLKNEPIDESATANEFLRLRLKKIVSLDLIIDNWLLVINDLIRSLSPWPGIWSTVPTKKGNLRISLTSHTGYVIPDILISGKPKPISYLDFEKYYLQ